MALNLKAALGICVFFIAGLCYVLNRVELPSQAAASQMLTAAGGAHRPNGPWAFRARRLARQSPVQRQRAASRETAAKGDDSAPPETRTVVLPPLARQETPSNRAALLVAEAAPAREQRVPAGEASAERAPGGALVAKVIEEAAPSGCEQPGALLTAIEPSRRTTPHEADSANQPSAAALAGTYKVKKGDSLTRIARQVFGSSERRYLRMLIEANPKIAKRTNKLFIGEELMLPSVASASGVSPRSTGGERARPAAQAPAAVASVDKPAGTAVATLDSASRKRAAVAAKAGKLPATASGERVGRKSGKKAAKGGSSGETPRERWYTIRASDSLASIARNLLKDGRRWRELAEANGLRDPNKIIAGKRIKLPADAQPEG
jgi:nucleoid-associated protein YgaU